MGKGGYLKGWHKIRAQEEGTLSEEDENEGAL